MADQNTTVRIVGKDADPRLSDTRIEALAVWEAVKGVVALIASAPKPGSPDTCRP